uniref:Uncharacterized protein n=1 Tax=Setaria italica TaxID=4555 RepID=K3YL70_SETIT
MTPLVARLFQLQGFTHFNWNVARGEFEARGVVDVHRPRTLARCRSHQAFRCRGSRRPFELRTVEVFFEL